MSYRENLKFAKNLYDEQLKKIYQNSEEWKKYLDFASNFYKYSFAETLLIYGQNPNVTACATIEQWNSIDRLVKKGEKSIKILSDSPDEVKLKYVFDVSQTWGNNKTLPKRWKVEEKIAKEVIAEIMQLSEIIKMRRVIKNMIYDKLINSDMSQEDKEIMSTTEFIENATDTIVYVLSKRCNLKIENENNLFNTFNEIQDIKQLKKLGIFSINETSELLKRIEHKVKQEMNKKKGEMSNESKQIWNTNQTILEGGTSNQISGIDNGWDIDGETGREATGSDGIQREDNDRIESEESIDREQLYGESTIRENDTKSSGRNVTRNNVSNSISKPSERVEQTTLFSLYNRKVIL